MLNIYHPTSRLRVSVLCSADVNYGIGSVTFNQQEKANE